MSSIKFRYALLLLIGMLLSACGDMTDDLLPSGDDKRPPVEEGTSGTQVGQQAPDFSLYDTLGNSRGLYTELATAEAVVLYFNMWCPICDAHASHMRADIMPAFPNVQFFLVDYVTGSITDSRAAQEANGYTDMDVLVDIGQEQFDAYRASMGTTVVIDTAGIVQMNEDYKDGARLRSTLEQLP
ncbi:MAG TPA: redoxin domain-containing protein [Gammaproteobacteria bacterium]|nr:redoxin domain-containing protein [Gammaproteobacteria bacterium]